MAVALRLYSRQGCHLCEEARDRLLEISTASDFTLVVADIDADPQLQREYALRIPVLLDIELNQIVAEQVINIDVVRAHLSGRSR